MVQPVVSEDLTARVTTLQQQILAESKPQKKRNAQGYPGTAAAFAAGDDDRCVHAGDSGKREGNDRSD